MRTIVFVCTGNTCRSPLAAAAFRPLAAAAGLTDVAVASAGLFAADGEPMPAQALFALHQAGMGDPPAPHRSQRLTPDLVEQAHLLVVMTHAQLDELRQRFPDAAPRTRLLLTFREDTRRDNDVPDPFGGDSETYIHGLETMLPALRGLVAFLRT